MSDPSRRRSENDRLRATLRKARGELARWGWGDMHYGPQGQEPRIVDMLAEIDSVLGGSPDE
jgi:hypothetical protein